MGISYACGRVLQKNAMQRICRTMSFRLSARLGGAESCGLPGTHDSGTFDIEFDKDRTSSIPDSLNEKFSGGK